MAFLGSLHAVAIHIFGVISDTIVIRIKRVMQPEIELCSRLHADYWYWR